MGGVARHAIVEFVPREDPMVAGLLAHREDVFDDYTLDGFLRAFGARFRVLSRAPVSDSTREIFLFERR
jgi:hypothetical protein